MDPWKNCQTNNPETDDKILYLNFENNFVPEVNDKLPDHEEYLAILEGKLKKIKSDQNIIRQLREKRELYMRQLLSDDNNCSRTEQVFFEEPITNSRVVRTILPEKDALNQGEIVEFIKYDQLSTNNSNQEENNDLLQ